MKVANIYKRRPREFPPRTESEEPSVRRLERLTDTEQHAWLDACEAEANVQPVTAASLELINWVETGRRSTH